MKRLSLASLLLTISSASLVLAAVDYKDANISGMNFTNSSYDSIDFTNSDFSGATVGTSASDSRTTTFNSSTVARNYSGSNFSGMSIGLTGYLSEGSSTYAYFDSAVLNNVNFSGMKMNMATVDMDGEEFYFAGVASFKNATITNANFSKMNFGEAANTWGSDNSRLNFTNATLKNINFQDLWVEGQYDSSNSTIYTVSGATLDNIDFRSAASYMVQSIRISNAASTKNIINIGSGVTKSVTVQNLELNSADDVLTIRTHSMRDVALSADSTFSGGTLEFVDKISSADNALLEVGAKTLLITRDLDINVYLSADVNLSEDVSFYIMTFTTGSIQLDNFSDVKEIISLKDYQGNAIDTSSWDAEIDGQGVKINITAVPEPATFAAIFGVLALGFVAWRKRR